MANYKRKRPKHQRAGCTTCKPWKDERGSNLSANGTSRMGTGKYTPTERRNLQIGRDER